MDKSIGEIQMKLSLYTIVKDEEFFLPIMLESTLAAVDEAIVIVDLATRDNTIKEIEKFEEYKTGKLKYFVLDYGDDFGKAKNFAQEKCTGDWIMLMDADEALEDDIVLTLKTFIEDCDKKGVEAIHTQYIHFIENFSKIDNTIPFHIGIARIYKKLPHVKYIVKNHALPTINSKKSILVPSIIYYHMGYLRGMTKILERFWRNYQFSEMHTPFDQINWRDWHYYGEYPTVPYSGKIPKAIRKAFKMDVIK